MTIETLAGSDSLVLDNELILDGADADCITLDYPNDMANIYIGKNDNIMITPNAQGGITDVNLRVCINGKTDKYLTNKLSQFKNDPASFQLINGIFTKRTGDGNGNLTKKIYNLSAGVIVKRSGAVDSTVGNVESIVSIWNLRFGICNITIV